MGWLKRGRDRPAPPAEAPVASVAAADPYSFQASHRRLAWMLRLSAGTNVVLGAAVTVLVSMFSVLLPLKHTEIALVRTNSVDDKLYRIEPISERVAGFQVLLESMARRYVRLVLEIDPITQAARFREASAMTDTGFLKRFREERLETKAYQEAVASGLIRTIHVESVDSIESFGRDHKFAVDLVQVDTREGKEVQRKALRAYLSMTTRPHEVREADKYTNPLGITVLDMVLKEKGL